MKKSDLQKIIREELKTVLNEGSWAIPSNPKELSSAIELFKQFKKLKQKLYKVMGDDDLFRSLAQAEERMAKLIETAYYNHGVK